MSTSASESSSQFAPMRTGNFKTREEALAYALNHARQNGFGLATRHSGNGGMKVYLCCDRGSYQHRKEYTPVPEEKRKRERGERQAGCSYRVHIRWLKKEKTWKVNEGSRSRPNESVHNHMPSIHAAGHPCHRRPTEEERNDILRLNKGGFKAAKILTLLKESAKPSGHETLAEAAIQLLEKMGWRYTFRDDGGGTLTDLLFIPGNCVKLLQRFPNVLFMDCTYNTNLPRLPLLDIVGCTNKNTTFPVMFGLINAETADAYSWAIKWRSRARSDECLGSRNASYTKSGVHLAHQQSRTGMAEESQFGAD